MLRSSETEEDKMVASLSCSVFDQSLNWLMDAALQETAEND